jgi:hypothetical protein
MPSPKLVPLLLTNGERESLEALVHKRAASQSLALQARIVLVCAEDERGQADAVVTLVLTERGSGQDTHCQRGPWPSRPG